MDQPTITIPQATYESLVSLARQVKTMLDDGPIWISAFPGDAIRQFDPDDNTADFLHFVKMNPLARTAFMFEVDRDVITSMSNHSDNLISLTRASEQSEVLIQGKTAVLLAGALSPLMPAEGAPSTALGNEITQAQIESLHAQRLKDASDESQLLCPRCENPTITQQHDVIAVSLLATGPGRPAIESANITRLVCSHCGHAEEVATGMASRRIALGKLIAQRLLLGQDIDRRDLYNTFMELHETLIYSGALMMEMMRELSELIHNPSGADIDDDGVFTGHFLLDPNDEWQCEIYEQLEALGVLKCVGSQLYKQVPMCDQAINPFAQSMMQETKPNIIH